MVALAFGLVRVVGAQLTPFHTWDVVAVCDEEPDVIRISVLNDSNATIYPRGQIFAFDEAQESEASIIAEIPVGRTIDPGQWSSVEDRIRNHYQGGVFHGQVWGWQWVYNLPPSDPNAEVVGWRELPHMELNCDGVVADSTPTPTLASPNPPTPTLAPPNPSPTSTPPGEERFIFLPIVRR